MSAVLLPWPVQREPSWPVLKADSMENASSPRTSPTRIRSGRIRRLARIRSPMEITRLPSPLSFLVSRRTRLGIWRI